MQRVTTNTPNSPPPVIPNQLEGYFRTEGPNQAQVGGITDLSTHEGRNYLAGVIDLYSCKPVGWSMSQQINSRLACDDLQMATWNRRPKEGLMFHSDRGVQCEP